MSSVRPLVCVLSTLLTLPLTIASQVEAAQLASGLPGRPFLIATVDLGSQRVNCELLLRNLPGHDPSVRKSIPFRFYNLWGQRVEPARLHAGFERSSASPRGPVVLGPYWVVPNSSPKTDHVDVTTAQLFVDVTETALPQDSSWAVGVASGDVDGDGDPDLVVVHNRPDVPTRPQLLINDGHGAFQDETASRLPELSLYPTGVKLVDVDLDGDLDLFVANRGLNQFRHTLLINDGTGHFVDESDERLPQENVCAGSVEFGDLNGDGAPDLAAVPLFLQVDSLSVLIFPNDGTGHFPDSLMRRVWTKARYTVDIAIDDLDGDGDQDLVLGCLPLTIVTVGGDTTVLELEGTNLVLMNQGGWQFVEESSSRLGSAPGDATTRVLTGDVDGDGDVDLYFCNSGFRDPQATDRLWINDGNGYFADETDARLPAVGHLWTNRGVLADFTGDGALDIFLPAVEPDSGGPALDRLYVNDGQGYFEDRSATDLPNIMDFSIDAAAADVDLDGDTDLFVANTTPLLHDTVKAVNRLYSNTGALSAVKSPGGARVPAELVLYPAYPNPFNASTRIGFDLPRAGQVELTVLDLMGRPVRHLLRARKEPGQHWTRWDGRDDNGRAVPSGVYLIQLRSDFRVDVRKVALVR